MRSDYMMEKVLRSSLKTTLSQRNNEKSYILQRFMVMLGANQTLHYVHTALSFVFL